MGWVKLDDGFPDHPKVVGLSLEARWAYIEALCYAAKYETDGLVPDVVAANGAVRDELIAAGLWESGTAAVEIHDFLIYNQSHTELEQKRKRSRSVRAGGGFRGGVLDVESPGGGGLGEGDTFDTFWETYPRKVGKPKARLAFKSAIARADPETIILGAKRYAEDANREDEYTAHPSTWLTRDGWDDPPLPRRGGRPVKPDPPRPVQPWEAAEMARKARRGPSD